MKICTNKNYSLYGSYITFTDCALMYHILYNSDLVKHIPHISLILSKPYRRNWIISAYSIISVSLF